MPIPTKLLGICCTCRVSVLIKYTLEDVPSNIIILVLRIRIHVFGPLGSGSISQRYGFWSGSGSFYHHAKMVNKPSKSNKQKKLFKKIIFLFASWRSMTKIAGSGSRIRSRIHLSEAWILGSGSTPKCHGSATLNYTLVLDVQRRCCFT